MSQIYVTVRYFAMLREQSGLAEEKLNLPQHTLQEIYSQLSDKYKFTLPVDRIRAAVNDQFCDMNYTAQEGDKIVFIPPVAGG